MEELLFYKYLLYNKRKKSPHAKIPICAHLIFLLTIFSFLSAIFLFYNNMVTLALIATFIEFSTCFALQYIIEQNLVRISNERMSEFFARCLDLEKWLISNSVTTRENILEIKQRIEKKINICEEQEHIRQTHLDKWYHALIVPTTILIITYGIYQPVLLPDKIKLVMNFIIICLSFYFISREIKKYIFFLEIKKTEQMKSFAANLQGILDLDTFNIRTNKCSIT